jgi:undecaprenyl phosphate-alpha-L-ara4N flippase subunit ArnE
MEYILILLSVCLTTLGQLFQKLGAQRAIADSTSGHIQFKTLMRPEIYLAISCLGAGLLIWLSVLYYMEVSKAFPFLSLGFVLVLLVSRFYLHEPISWQRWVGVAMIVLGIVLIAQT